MSYFRNLLLYMLIVIVQVPCNLEADASQSCLSKNVVSLLSETIKIKINALDQWPADISFLCADLKYTGQAVKICEFGGMLSSIKDTPVIINGIKETLTTPYWDLFWQYLAQFNKPIWYVGKLQERILKELVCIKGESFKDLSGFLKYFKRIAPQYFHKNKNESMKRKLEDYEGILVINERVELGEIKQFIQKYPNILLVNAHTKIFTKKCHSFRLFNEHDELKNFIPGWKEYKKKYTPELAQTIMHDIPADFYIIKPMSAVQSRGVLMIAKEDLDFYLKYILHEIESLKSPYDENLLYWKTDPFQSFYVQEYVPSKEIILQGKKYDPTMRLFFFLSYEQGSININVVAGYWKIPLKSLDEPGTLMEKHISHSLLGRAFTGILVEPNDLKHTKELMKAILPVIYPQMLKYAHDESNKKMRLSKKNRTTEEIWW